MGLELELRFAKPVLKADVEAELEAIEGIVANGDRGVRWENDELEGFFTVDHVEPEKQKKRKPKLEGLDINVPWGGPTEEIGLLTQILEALAAKFECTVTTPLQSTPMSAGGFAVLESVWHRSNVQNLIAWANQDDMSLRTRRERFDDDDPARVEIADASRLSVEPDQREAYQCNCAMRVAQALQRCGEHKLAIVTAHRVLDRLPKETFAHVLLGISFAALGDSDTARTVYQRACDIDPVGQYANYAQTMLEQLA
jgi:tetratricopeptide (TPR) repeat protein